ncbi:MAG: hypothetical protein OJF49_004314 [Ktedonobacterales bacterium]|nr:MAG: hypothetical protein OJF49_004314 [Ktedonobacterales bacterium]
MQGAQQRPWIRRTQDKLPAVAPPQSFEKGRRGTDEIRISNAKRTNQLVHPVGEVHRFDLRGIAVGMLERVFHEASERRIAVACPRRNFRRIELCVVVARRRLQREMLRVEGLHQHLSWQVAAPRAPRNLGQQLKCPLRCAEVGQEQRDIRRDHAHQRHAGQVKPLGNHLCADQYIGAPLSEGAQQFFVRLARAGGIAVPAQHPRAGELPLHRRLHPLRAQAEIADAGAPTIGAGRRRRLTFAAVVADQRALRRMIRHRDIAVRAARHIATLAADHAAGRPPAVEEQYRLLTAINRLMQSGAQRVAEDAGVAVAQLRPQVHQRDGWQGRERSARTCWGTLAQFDECVCTLARQPIGFDRWGGAAQDDCRARKRAQAHGGVTRMVGGHALLLICGLMLLIYDDDAQAVHRREERRPRTDDHIHCPRPDTPPLAQPLGWGQLTMQQRHPPRKAPGKARHSLRSQRNFRHEDDAAQPPRQRCRQRLQVYLSLAAASDAMQQEDSRLVWGSISSVAGGQRVADRRQCRRLRRCQRQRLTARGRTTSERIVPHFDLCQREESPRCQFVEGAGAGAGKASQVFEPPAVPHRIRVTVATAARQRVHHSKLAQEPLGTALVRRGFLPRRALQRHVRQRIQFGTGLRAPLVQLFRCGDQTDGTLTAAMQRGSGNLQLQKNTPGGEQFIYHRLRARVAQRLFDEPAPQPVPLAQQRQYGGAIRAQRWCRAVTAVRCFRAWRHAQHHAHTAQQSRWEHQSGRGAQGCGILAGKPVGERALMRREQWLRKQDTGDSAQSGAVAIWQRGCCFVARIQRPNDARYDARAERHGDELPRRNGAAQRLRCHVGVEALPHGKPSRGTKDQYLSPHALALLHITSRRSRAIAALSQGAVGGDN